MTTIGHRNIACAVCGTEAVVPFVNSTNTMGPPDLDLRPAEMMRSTIWTHVQRCASCGYCAADISSAHDNCGDVIASVTYRDQLANEAFPELANSFLCAAIVASAFDEEAAAAHA